MAYVKAIAKNPTSAARSAQDVITLIKKEMSTYSKKLTFVEVQEVAKFVRPAKKEVIGIKVSGIQKLHHITRTADGHLIGRKLSCSDCLQYKTQLCNSCTQLKPLYTPNNKETLIDNTDINCQDDEEEEAITGATMEDFGDSDNDGFSEEDETEDEVFGPGSVVWARLWGEKVQWFPVIVLATQDVPPDQAHIIVNQKDDTLFVRRFFFNDVKVVKKKSF